MPQKTWFPIPHRSRKPSCPPLLWATVTVAKLECDNIPLYCDDLIQWTTTTEPSRTQFSALSGDTCSADISNGLVWLETTPQSSLVLRPVLTVVYNFAVTWNSHPVVINSDSLDSESWFPYSSFIRRNWWVRQNKMPKNASQNPIN